MFFFFQAEDGIRYLVRSRGLGDVYKRQTETSVQLLREFERTGDSVPFEAFMRRHAAMVYALSLIHI